jgi:hypothetical protein
MSSIYLALAAAVAAQASPAVQWKPLTPAKPVTQGVIPVAPPVAVPTPPATNTQTLQPEKLAEKRPTLWRNIESEMSVSRLRALPFEVALTRSVPRKNFFDGPAELSNRHADCSSLPCSSGL